MVPMPRGLSNSGVRGRRGIILVLVLVVIAMLALAAFGFSELMLSERRAAQTASRLVRARVLAQSGAELARQFLDRDPTDQTEAGGLYDNADRFSAQLVADDDSPQDRGRFTILAPRLEDTTVSGIRFGLQDESSRINLAVLLSDPFASQNKAILMNLPGMTDDISDAILDWMDADSTSRPSGAEADYYGALTPAYAPRNSPPATIEELLSVRGVTPQLLFGLDAGGLGMVPEGASADDGMTGVDNSDGSMDHGWAQYLTLWSAESNLKPDGTQKINLNDGDLQKLYTSLTQLFDENTAKFVIFYRQNGPAKTSGGAAGTAPAVDFKKAGGNNFKTLLDLIGASTTVTVSGSGTNSNSTPGPNNGSGSGVGSPSSVGTLGTISGKPGGGSSAQSTSVTLKSPFTNDSGAMGTYLPKLLDNCTVTSATSIPGRININLAPRTVLTCIPGLTSDIVDQIIARRVPDPTVAPADQKYATWLLVEQIVPLKTMQALWPYVTSCGSVYRAHILGHFDKGSTSARLEVLLDATQHPTKLLFWKDMSRLPGGFSVELLGQGATK